MTNNVQNNNKNLENSSRLHPNYLSPILGFDKEILFHTWADIGLKAFPERILMTSKEPEPPAGICKRGEIKNEKSSVVSFGHLEVCIFSSWDI